MSVAWGTLVAMDRPPALRPADWPDAVVEPVGRALLGQLRRAVLAHAHEERRRVYPPVVHVGTPAGGPVVTFGLGDQLGERGLDHALRTDVLEAMVRRVARASSTEPATPPLVWLTRPGPLEPRDVDLAWLAAARSAAAELGRALPMVVVNRRSWRDPATGASREWTRINRPPTRPTAPPAERPAAHP